ncbi:MAG TPA: MarR family transcriptional regulator [Solirubrobacteraceae bacterium]|nr:MarR family transcriptional regulator [Solirubrobacteraceae bacterium]
MSRTPTQTRDRPPAPTAAPGERPEDMAPRLRAAIGRLGRHLRRTSADVAAGLTPTKVSVLLTVAREGPMRLSALAESEGLNPTMLSRAISDLVDAGLVTRTCDGADRRAAWAQATPAGERVVARMRRRRTDALHRALDELSEEDRLQLQRCLPALERLADALRGRA